MFDQAQNHGLETCFRIPQRNSHLPLSAKHGFGTCFRIQQRPNSLPREGVGESANRWEGSTVSRKVRYS
jgi:hypothetical protein